MEVKVSRSCDRCKRKEEIAIDSANISELESRDKETETVEASIKEFFSNLGPLKPDLIVVFKGEVQITRNVCDAHCVKPVKNQLENAFRVAKPRQARGTGKGKDKKSGDNKGGKNKGAAAPPAG